MDVKTLARKISLIENEADGFEELLSSLSTGKKSLVIGITGAPGAGKSTLVDALIGQLVSSNKKVAVLCVDPSSPFNLGAVLGDRIRMSSWYTNPNVFIRSLATRGSLGGLHPKIIEITDLLQSAGFDYIIVETVGVGQSEIEIAGLADVTVVVVVPEGGDEVQTMKAGLMEIADIFVVNKSDRHNADLFVKNLQSMSRHVPVLKTIASENKGIKELATTIEEVEAKHLENDHKYWLLTEKAYQLIAKRRMGELRREELMKEIKSEFEKGSFNLYEFTSRFTPHA
ncbi:MAG TPA: methylmalonyl Co-A mutase-associated GTPase MeaB [Chitinophagaceae bacterium]|nr:methylmalonyl Co-A mutase-associated GTPase MeaB [Chitinophagaceae bacterium]